MTRRYALRDDQWEKIEGLLPGREDTVGVTAKDNRLFVEAVLYRYRAGIPWRDLPERLGEWKNVHRGLDHHSGQGQVLSVEKGVAGPSKSRTLGSANSPREKEDARRSCRD